jgi:hypothetical protein
MVEQSTRIQPSNRSRAVLGYVVAALGVAVAVFAVQYWVFAFFVWIGSGIDKESFDAGTIVLPIVLSVAGLSLFFAGAWAVRTANTSYSDDPATPDVAGRVNSPSLPPDELGHDSEP